MTATSLYTLLTSFAFSPSSLPFTSGLPPIQKARSFHWNAYSISRQAICVIIQRDFTHPSTLDSCVLCIPAGASASGGHFVFTFRRRLCHAFYSAHQNTDGERVWWAGYLFTGPECYAKFSVYGMGLRASVLVFMMMRWYVYLWTGIVSCGVWYGGVGLGFDRGKMCRSVRDTNEVPAF